jgi:glc operon protein GlcG
VPRLAAALSMLAALVIPHLARAQMPNPYGAPITTEVAKRVAGAALAEARKNGWAVYATVVDAGGAVAYVERIDGVQTGSAENSLAKARTAVAFKRPSKVYEDRVAQGQLKYLRLPGAVPLDGGLPILVDGKIVGALGVSGASASQDGQCAQVGAEAAQAPPPK